MTTKNHHPQEEEVIEGSTRRSIGTNRNSNKKKLLTQKNSAKSHLLNKSWKKELEEAKQTIEDQKDKY